MRRMSGPLPPRKSSHANVLPNNMQPQRRYSVQTDGSQQYLPPNINHFTSQQSRFHCIQSQKAPLRNMLSAPQSNMNIDMHRNMQPQQQFPVNLPPQPLMQRQDSNVMQSLESIDDMCAQSVSAELARYKTELCRPYEETGECRYGNKCQFAHGGGELRSLNRHPKYKTEFCRTYHTTGFCSYGQRCNFIHNDDERRGPVPVARVQPMPQQKPVALPPPLMLPITAPLTITSHGDSRASSVCGSSPSQSPHYLVDDVFPTTPRLSPTPSFGSDGNSLASSGSFSPPSSPKQENAFSPLELGFSLSLFSGLSL